MPVDSFAPLSAGSARGQGIGKLWISAGGGAFAACCALLAIHLTAGGLSGPLMTLALSKAFRAEQGVAFGNRAPSPGMQVLSGVSGETVAPGSEPVGAEIASAPTAGQLAGGQLSPVAWDRLSAGDCISLTIASGQKLSFRILGARSSDPARAPAEAAKLDLAVTACDSGSELILKAVIESKAEGKESAVQRNL